MTVTNAAPVFLPKPPENPTNEGAIKKWLYLVYLSLFNSAGITLPIQISQGGTGADTLADAQSNLGIIPLPIAGDSNLVLQTNGTNDPVWSTQKLVMGGDITFADDFTTSGSFPVTFTFTATTGVIFPTTGTLATSTDLGAYLPLAGGTMTGTINLDGDPITFIGLNWTGADQENLMQVPSAQLQAFAVQDTVGNQYWHVNSSTDRPKLSLDIETQINTPFIDTNVLATGTIYNSTAILTASASGGSVTGISTNFPTQCANGIIYWPATQSYARIITRNSATSLTIDTSISLSAAPFVLYWGGVTYNPQTNIFALSAITSLVFGDGSSFTTSGNHPTTLTTTGTTNSTLPVGTTTLVPTTGTGASGTWAITAANVTTNANLTGDVTSVGNASSYNNAVPLSKSLNANLTANNGGIFYSTASAGAILSGTATAGKVLQSGATAAPTWSTPTYPSTSGTSGKVLISDGTNNVYSTPTFPNASASSGKFIRSDGTNWVASTPTLPTSAGTSGKVLQSNGTNYVESTPTYPSASGSTGTILRSDGTNNVYSTSTFADTYAINSLLVASSANTITALAPANNGVYQSSATGVVSASTSQTYTPTIGDGTNNFTGGTASGWYYRIGARTFVNINISWTGKGSAGAGNSIRISLPITAGATPNSNTFSIGFTNGITSTTQLLAFANSGDSYIQLINFVSGSSATGVLVSSMGTNGQIQLSGWIGS